MYGALVKGGHFFFRDDGLWTLTMAWRYKGTSICKACSQSEELLEEV